MSSTSSRKEVVNSSAQNKQKVKELFEPIYVGFMRMITLNFSLWCRPTRDGWRRHKWIIKWKNYFITLNLLPILNANSFFPVGFFPKIILVVPEACLSTFCLERVFIEETLTAIISPEDLFLRSLIFVIIIFGKIV